jgi:hypothetical protein
LIEPGLSECKFILNLSWKQEAMLGNKDKEVRGMGGFGNMFAKCD